MTSEQIKLWRTPPAQRFKNRGRGVRRQPGVMNSLEKRYAARLETLKATGRIECYTFDAIKLRLADKCFYTPDFFVMTASGEIEMHEAKGFWEDDARVKIKVAASLYPFRFVAARWVKGAWELEEF